MANEQLDAQPQDKNPSGGTAESSASGGTAETSADAGTDALRADLSSAVDAAVPVSPRPLPPPDHDATSSSLHSGLQGDVDKLSMLNAVVAIAAGALMFAVPGFFRWLFHLGGATDYGLRVLGAYWVLVGLWFAATAAQPRSRLITTVNVLILAITAVGMLAAPLVLGLDVGWFGWLALFAVAVYCGASATAWMLIRNRMAGRVKPRQIEDTESAPAS